MIETMRVKDEKKEQAIFDAAITLITTNGLADTSMSKIAKVADVSAATIYIYFENKEDMLNKTYTHVKREIAAALGKGLQPKLTVEEAFKVIWNNFYKYAVKNSVKFSFTEQFANSCSSTGFARKKECAIFNRCSNGSNAASAKRCLRTCR